MLIICSLYHKPSSVHTASLNVLLLYVLLNIWLISCYLFNITHAPVKPLLLEMVSFVKDSLVGMDRAETISCHLS